jgi:hypothetical protein
MVKMSCMCKLLNFKRVCCIWCVVFVSLGSLLYLVCGFFVSQKFNVWFINCLVLSYVLVATNVYCVLFRFLTYVFNIQFIGIFEGCNLRVVWKMEQRSFLKPKTIKHNQKISFNSPFNIYF